MCHGIGYGVIALLQAFCGGRGAHVDQVGAYGGMVYTEVQEGQPGGSGLWIRVVLLRSGGWLLPFFEAWRRVLRCGTVLLHSPRGLRAGGWQHGTRCCTRLVGAVVFRTSVPHLWRIVAAFCILQ